MLFSHMTTEECFEVITKNGTNLDAYTEDQIKEMDPVPTTNGFMLPTITVKDKEGTNINTGISVERFYQWKNNKK